MKIANKCSFETQKSKNEKNNIITNKQCDTIIKMKKNYYFKYILSYKPISCDNLKK